MRLITTQRLRVGDASKPLGPDGFFPRAEIGPGQFDLEEIPNPHGGPPANVRPEYWCKTWLVVRGTMLGMSREGWHHNFVHHRDPAVLLSI